MIRYDTIDVKVQVFMSTYNGEEYVAKQINSILQQEGVEVRLLIRDDGSKDATMDILKQFDSRYENVKVYTGKHLGVCGSFFDLIKNADEDMSYYAFADQDDVWKKEKLKRAVALIDEVQEIPVLYCGSYDMVDSRLEYIEGRRNSAKKNISFGNALIECNCTGCTAVFNKRLFDLIQQLPQHAYMHDWWLYLVATAMGTVVYDKEPYILYRQHAHNLLGIKQGRLKHMIWRVKNYKNLRRYVPAQLREFQAIYGNKLTSNQNKLLECMLNENKNLLKRLKIFRMSEIRRNSGFDNVIYKLMFLFWKI